MEWLELLIFFGLIAFAAAILTLGSGRILGPFVGTPTQRAWWRPVLATLLLFVVAAEMYEYGPWVYYYGAIFIEVTAVLAAWSLVWQWRAFGWRSVIVTSVLFGVVYPLTLAATNPMRAAIVLDAHDACAAPLVVDALQRYRGFAGGFPASLDDVYHEYPRGAPSFPRAPQPTFTPLDTIPMGHDVPCVANRATNWLYRYEGKTYTLGYWRRYPLNGPFPVRICTYHSNEPGWHCGWYDWGPFAPAYADD